MTSATRWQSLAAGSWIVMLVAQTAEAQFPIDIARIRETMPVPTAPLVVAGREGPIREIRGGVSSITVGPGEFVLAKMAERPVEVSAPPGGGMALQLPVTLSTVASTGAQVSLGIVVRTGYGLMPRGDTSRYEGKIFVGLVNTLDPTTTVQLPAPVQVTLTGPVDSISPDQPDFISTNTFVPVTLTARNPRDPVALTIATSASETTVPVSVVNSRVDVVTSVPRIAGFGFETAEVTVQASGVPNAAGMTVTLFLQGGGGSFVPTSQLVLDENGRATARLRSSGLSPNVVVAATLGNGTTAQALSIAYDWPLDWLIFALGGAVAGGIVKQLSGKRRHWLSAFVMSVVVGCLAAGLYTLGVSTVPSLPAGVGGQLIVAVVAALTSLAGVWALPIPKPA